jgi:hypothetical protein
MYLNVEWNSMEKADFVNKLHMVKSLIGLIHIEHAHDLPRKKSVIGVCDELMGKIDHDGIDFLEPQKPQIVVREVQVKVPVEAPILAPRAEPWPAYVKWHKASYSGFPPPPLEKMNAGQKDRYNIWMAGYNAT